jgi:hypothetical protein
VCQFCEECLKSLFPISKYILQMPKVSERKQTLRALDKLIEIRTIMKATRHVEDPEEDQLDEDLINFYEILSETRFIYLL